ncbi:DUF2809 domain-containing protein [Paenibacillus sp. N4]|uniref:ribosomal maturation YjgA family protein n=1 Tax=Paenibacillus vietnamensis TaxID=2590547 RepID=UPI001CD12C00|nr:DUF2809 domain-containing protein [Paenibacillus vietnamensis]MCA0756116.1 DUF2809 domain-containing protein [Paenibacillus vietnamensis]
MKTRLPYLAAAAAAMLLGYCSRAYSGALPAFAREHFGDALWAGMIYFGIRFLAVRWKRRHAALASALFCYGIEFSQLYQTEWIAAVRSTALGALVLGSGFLTVDLVRYSAGIAAALLIDVVIFGSRSERRTL